MKQWRDIQIPFTGGLDLKDDARVSSPPQFDILKDAEFEEIGGLQTRKPYAALSSSIFGGGSLSDTRQIVANGNELLCFTKESLYSWNATISKWVLKATHVAAKIDETDVFATPGDQTECERAEMNDTIVYAWTDATQVYAAAVDKPTGAVIAGPTAIADMIGRPRLVALSTKILLFGATADPALTVYPIDPADPGNASSGFGGGNATVFSALTFNSYYDVVRIPGTDKAIGVFRCNPTTSYQAFTCDASLTLVYSDKARTCDGPIAVSVDPTGTDAQVIRGNGTNIQGDLLLVSTLADVYTAQAVGTVTALTTPTQITCAHRSVQNSSAYRCYAFWDFAENVGDSDITIALFDWGIKSNWVDTAGSLGTQSLLLRRTGVASRAFDYNGSVYVWGAFEQQCREGGLPSIKPELQNTYFLYRDNGTLHAKACWAKAGGHSPTTGWLPGVSAISSTEFAWCGTVRNIVPLDLSQTGYADRGPRDISITFDSNAARRCVRLGRTLYVAGGEVLQYDGVQLAEVGFHIYPWYLQLVEIGTGGLANGLYAYKYSWRWLNAAGESERSTTATTATITIATGPDGVEISPWFPLYWTHKLASAAAGQPHGISAEVWRTQLAPTADSPFYLVTSKDPTATTGANCYVPSDHTAAAITAFDDGLIDADIAINETHPENGDVLENLAPPSASIIAASTDRLFLAGVAGDPDRVWYSKQRGAGEVAAFNDALTFTVPPEGGAITALAMIGETLAVFRETAVYMVPGQGFDNLGGGQNYGPVSKVPGDVGAVSAESVAVTPVGIVFKSSKGFYVLTQQWACTYIGGPVDDYDSESVVSIRVVESQHQIRILTASRMLVLDYRVSQWAEWTIANGAGQAIWQSTNLYLNGTTNTVYQQGTTFSGVDYGMDVETSWIKLNDLQGAGSVRWLSILGEYRGSHSKQIRLARDYLQDGSGNWVYYQDTTPTVSPTTVGSAERLRIGPKVPKCEAIKVRITVLASGGGSPNNEACKLSGLGLEVGIDTGLFKLLPAAQKA